LTPLLFRTYLSINKAKQKNLATGGHLLQIEVSLGDRHPARKIASIGHDSPRNLIEKILPILLV
jgi:hypothetical protein